ncbi:MAG: mandelate racemase/muconate lactonizing enzyme family protein, partial [Alphaproteobacteria bacterium]|nr:mandelate racemase/muconate lactonizing enzyme family protein [Alphaproteobacteria bacterium]
VSPTASPAVAVYASAPDVSRLEDSVEEMLADGHTAAKLKIGFSRERDVSLMRRFRAIAGDRLGVMADANQKWSLQEATAMIAALADFDPRFVEEPLSADAPPEDWARLARASAVPIAAGENICSRRSFRELAARGGLRVLQPDVAKWGGASGAFAVAREARAAGLTCAMHYMGTALGLAASAHVLSAAGGDGPVELDVNPNPLRTELGDSDFTVTRGHIRIPRGDGIGFTPDPAALKKFSVKTADLHPRVRH